MKGRKTRVFGKVVCGLVFLAMGASEAAVRSQTPWIPISRNSKEEAPFGLRAKPDYRVRGEAKEGKIESATVESQESGGYFIDWDEPKIIENGKKVIIDGHAVPNAVWVPAEAVWMSAVFKGTLSIPGVGKAPAVLAPWEIDTMKTALTIDSFEASYYSPNDHASIRYEAGGRLGKPGGRLAGNAVARGVATPPDWHLDPANTPWHKVWYARITGPQVGGLARLVLAYNPPDPYKPVTNFGTCIIRGVPREPPLFPPGPPPGVPPGPPDWTAASR